MKTRIYWKKIKHSNLETWYFWSDNFKFWCLLLLSAHKKRRPIRVFLEFAKYRFESYSFLMESGEFLVEQEKLEEKIK